MTQQAPPTLTDAQAITAAQAPAPVTKNVTVQPAPFDSPGAYRFAFYKADAKGVTPLEWRCQVTGPGGIFADVALSALGIAQPDALLARILLAAVGQ